MSKVDRASRVTVNGHTFSRDELDWARDNLEQMRRNARNNTVLYLTLAGTLALGVIVYLLGVLIAEGIIGLPEGWGANLLADFLYNLGIALWTSVIIVFFLEVIVEYQQRRWQQYLIAVEQALEQLGEKLPAGEEEAADPLAARLEAIQAELAEIKARLAPPGGGLG